MNYELAKELKEAGFPQGDMPSYDIEGYIHRTPEQEAIWVHVPTLEELIEACGDTYFRLVHPIGEWCASIGIEENPIWYRGSTPTEAVARLWLALNKKWPN